MPLSPKERGIFDAIEAGHQPTKNSDAQSAHRAASKGWIEKRSDGWQIIEHSNTVAFIPNSFVKVSEGDSPLKRLMNFGELGPIMLAAELYQLQNLMDERGVPLDIIRENFHASDDFRIDHYRLHHLRPGRFYEDEETGKRKKFYGSYGHSWRVPGSGSEIWENLHVLERAHLIEWAVYSANGKPSEHDKEYAYNRPQRPLGVLRNGRQVLNTPESRPAFMAFLVYKLLKQESGSLTKSLPKLIEEWQESGFVFAFEKNSVSHVEGVSILRMTHRAGTENAKVWYRDLCQECEGAFFFVANAAGSHFPQIHDIVVEIHNKPNLEEAISM